MPLTLFSGAFECFGQGMLADDDLRPVRALPELLQAEVLDALLLNIYGPELLASHRSVLMSQWSKYYFMQVIPPVVAAGLVHGWRWPLQLDQIAVALDERGVPVGLRFLGVGTSQPVSFTELMNDNLHPFINALSRQGDVSKAVLWGNAGDYLERCLVQLSTLTDISLDAGYELLRSKTLSDGQRNPLFDAIRYVGEPPRRQRRSCCLSHQVAWVGRCEHCPIGAD
ncbi:siderophore-iron reductase FhuF [Pseudomonas folii]|uniref:Siderophore-iron reductase FhuF n=1 Tax=Pseudomonas folii TaxID=2762593 RepID=A0ABR7B4D6_9PSED|nr:siderophore-iron reductase FhuF [Pseudomonas folii]MBC3952026.1 siderophore-iron reductase FhuF [Pseudomonas folii]